MGHILERNTIDLPGQLVYVARNPKRGHWTMRLTDDGATGLSDKQIEDAVTTLVKGEA